jgi:hypothetical protein
MTWQKCEGFTAGYAMTELAAGAPVASQLMGYL